MTNWLSKRWAETAVASLLVLEVAAVVFLVVESLRTDRGLSGADLKTLVAVMAVVGTIFAASVTLLGLLLKQAVDRRTSDLALAQEKRATTEVRRLQMQTAVEMIKMLIQGDGTPAPAFQVSASLLAMARLGELRIALDIAKELWPQGRMTTSGAVELCSEALASNRSDEQRSAANLLTLCSDQLVTTIAGRPVAYWPNSVATLPDTLPPEIRSQLLTVAKGMPATVISRFPTSVQQEINN